MLLGKGGFGTVRLIVDLTEKNIWAIKTFEKQEYLLYNNISNTIHKNVNAII